MPTLHAFVIVAITAAVLTCIAWPCISMQLGGVYADIDVECLKPIDEWNMQHGNDAAVLLGVECFDMNRKHRVHINNWVMAAMPGHPLLAQFPSIVMQQIQRQYFQLARGGGKLSSVLYEQGILDRTGPSALRIALYEHFKASGLDLTNVTESDLNGRQGVIAGGVRVLPMTALSTGWRVALARSKGEKYSCADVAAANPQALVCHMFWGSWRSTWQQFNQHFSYEDC